MPGAVFASGFRPPTADFCPLASDLYLPLSACGLETSGCIGGGL